jgi:hypothetical protein
MPSATVSLVRGKAGLDQFTDACVNDAAVSAMRRQVEVGANAGLSTIAAEMEFVTKGGSIA